MNCTWSDWNETKCNATCGNAFKTYTRTVIQKAAFGGLQCTGESTITENCNLKPCPGNKDTLMFLGAWKIKEIVINLANKNIQFYFAVDCKLGPYKSGSCSATCGINAVRTRTRQVIQKAAYGGKDCQGKTKITENCGLLPCSGKYSLIPRKSFDIKWYWMIYWINILGQ